MNTLKFVALPDYVSSLTLLRLVIVIKIDEICSQIKGLVTKSQSSSLIARSTIDFQMNIYNKYATTYLFFCWHIFSQRRV